MKAKPFKMIVTVVVAAFLSGCNDEYRQADDSILCDPISNKAYSVTRGAGATSFVRPAQKYNDLCRKATGEHHE